MVDIARDARWAREEGAGEDPYLGSKVAEARVIGFQGGRNGEGLGRITHYWPPETPGSLWCRRIGQGL